MANQAPGERLLAGFARAIFDADFSAEEKVVAAEALRSGKITECLLGLLEFGASRASDGARAEPTQRSSQPDRVSAKDIKVPSAAERRANLLTVDSVFQTLRRRKIPKTKLIGMIQHLNTGLDLDGDDTTSMRELLAQFKDLSTETEWVTLARMISGDVEVDTYLRNIMNH